MRIEINAKQIQKKRQHVASYGYELQRMPADLRELISMLVQDSVREYNSRINSKESGQPLSADDLDSMSRIGKIGFGIPYGSREADPQEAVETAIQGFEDGLFRFFLADREIESLDVPLELKEGDTITIIRLVMLTGGFLW